MNMGMPDFFRWLIQNYPNSFVEDCVEYSTVIADKSECIKNDLAQDSGCDNFYIDMNGVIHTACHPKHQPPPANESVMLENMYKLLDRLLSIARPRRLLYIAIDGVAPQAKVNQQRVRRFRESKREMEKEDKVDKIRASLKSKGRVLPLVGVKPEEFDSNCITPGTEFIFRVADCLRYYVHHRLNTDPGWANVIVILSNANVPGEGEHKIMDYIRRQRAQPDYDYSMRHYLYSADADLILLGLSLHESHFTIIREKYVSYKPSLCHVCYELGHRMRTCVGSPQKWFKKTLTETIYPQEAYVLVHLSELREFVAKDMYFEHSELKRDVNCSVDDWIMLCLLIKNDFLPSIPSLKISENAIQLLISLYKKAVQSCGQYLTDNGVVNLVCLQSLFQQLSEVEADIFVRRHEAKKYRVRDDTDLDDDCLWLDGWHERYYTNKYNTYDVQLQRKISREYIVGLHWILKYFKQSCLSWNWYYPYHFSPFACDLAAVGDIEIQFDECGSPLRPLEHLMRVLPATSRQFLPESWSNLMICPSSPIADLYSNDFQADLSDLKIDNEGEIILPFVEEPRLLAALKSVYSDLTQDEVVRNSPGLDEMFFSRRFLHFLALKEHLAVDKKVVRLNSTMTHGLHGLAFSNGSYNNRPEQNGFHPDILFVNPLYKPGYVYRNRKAKFILN